MIYVNSILSPDEQQKAAEALADGILVRSLTSSRCAPSDRKAGGPT
jgi:hypothetical protein